MIRAYGKSGAGACGLGKACWKACIFLAVSLVLSFLFSFVRYSYICTRIFPPPILYYLTTSGSFERSPGVSIYIHSYSCLFTPCPSNFRSLILDTKKFTSLLTKSTRSLLTKLEKPRTTSQTKSHTTTSTTPNHHHATHQPPNPHPPPPRPPLPRRQIERAHV